MILDFTSRRVFNLPKAKVKIGVPSTTDGLAEGVVNLYFSNTRARAAFSATSPALVSSGVISLDLTASWTWTANGIAATPTDRIQLSNTTAAIAGTQQYSPAMRFTGQGFNSTGGVSQSADFRIYCVPSQTAGTVGANLLIDYSAAGGAFANKATLSSAGRLTLAAGIIGNGDLDFSAIGGNSAYVNTTGMWRWLNRSRMQSPADGIIGLYNNAGSDFTRLQFGGTTSSFPALARSGTTLKCRLAGDTDDAGFTSTNFISSTVGVGFNGSAAVGKSSAYMVTNHTTDRAYDCNSTSIDEVADVLGTLILDLQTVGLLG